MKHEKLKISQEQTYLGIEYEAKQIRECMNFQDNRTQQ